MRETILALLALSIVTTMSLGVLSTSIHSQLQQVDREIEVYASGVATQVMDYISSRSFDERTTPDKWKSLGEPADSSQFDAFSQFGTGGVTKCNLFEPFNDSIVCDDIDDAHMDTIWQPFTYAVDTLGTFDFEVNAQVFYVDIATPDSVLTGATRTNTKKVIVNVRSAQHHQNNRPGGFVQLERLITYDPVAASAHALASVPVCSGSTTIYVNNLQVPIYLSQGASAGACP